MSEPSKSLTEGLTGQLRQAGAVLPPAGRRVARFIAQNRTLVLALSAAELAKRIGTSDATVVRSVQAMGFPGLAALKRDLAASLTDTDPATPAAALRHTLAEAGAEAAQAMDLALATQLESVQALAVGPARVALGAAVAALNPARRILVFGLGPSAALAGYAALLLARAGRPARALDAAGAALADRLLDLQEGDALLVLAYGRAYREVSAIFAEARRLSLPLVLLSDSLDRRLAAQADVLVPVQRGRARRVALHGATLVALEAILLGLAAMQGDRALAALDRLDHLRRLTGAPPIKDTTA